MWVAVDSPRMSETRVGYVGVEHHHRDPYFQIASELPVTIAAVCEPGKRVEEADLAPLEDRPDEITAAGSDVAAVAADATVYEDPEALLAAESLDALWITYANDETPAIVDAAVEEGVHVLSEKPIARTADDLAPVARRADAAGVEVTPTFFYRTNPIVEDLRARVAEGQFGDVWSIEGRFVGSQLAYRDTSHYIYDRERSRGGALQWIGPHWIDLMMHVLDEPIVRVSANTVPASETDVEAGGTLQFETQGGTMGTFQNGYYLDGRGKDTHLGIYGTDAQARSPVHHDPMAQEPTTPVELVSGREDWAAAPRRTTDYEFAYERFDAWGDYVLTFFEAFFEGLDDRTVPADADDALRLLRVLDAAYESAESGEWVPVDE